MNSNKFQFFLEYLNTSEDVESKKIVLIVDECLENSFNSEQNSFLEEITKKNIQIMKFFDYEDLLKYFEFLSILIQTKKTEIFRAKLESEKYMIAKFEEKLNV